MWIFGRPDGTRVGDLPPIRQTMPFVCPTRHEAATFHRLTLDVDRAVEWLRRFNEGREGPRATFFHLFLWASARNLHAFPHLNRFASGGRIYQRDGVSIAFSVKRSFEPDAPFELRKLDCPPDEPFEALVGRVHGHVRESRAAGAGGLVDLEMALVPRVPAFVVRLAVGLLRLADRHNLLPASMIRGDPMFCSFMVANLGSVGLGAVHHHLSDYGTCSLFATLGTIDRRPVVRDGSLGVGWTVDVCYTMDERSFDGFYAARAIAHLRSLIEDPFASIGPPEASQGPTSGAMPNRAM